MLATDTFHSSPTSFTSSPFCNVSNLSVAADYINRELSLIGIVSSPLQFVSPNTDQSVDIVNALFALFQSRQRDRAILDDLYARFHRLNNDYQHQSMTITNNQQHISQLDREIRSQLGKYSKLETTHNEVQEKLKNTLDELKFIKSSFTQAKNHFTHDKRKWEREMTQLKTKMQKVTQDRARACKLSFKITSYSITSSTQACGPRRTTHPINDYHLMLLRDVESREQTLLLETHSLKQVLHEVWVELQHVHSSMVPGIQVVDLPFELVRDTVAHRVRELILTIRDEWVRLCQQIQELHEDTNDDNNNSCVPAVHDEFMEAAREVQEQTRRLEEDNRQLDEFMGRIHAILGNSAKSSSISKPISSSSSSTKTTAVIPVRSVESASVHPQLISSIDHMQLDRHHPLPPTVSTSTSHPSAYILPETPMGQVLLKRDESAVRGTTGLFSTDMSRIAPISSNNVLTDTTTTPGAITNVTTTPNTINQPMTGLAGINNQPRVITPKSPPRGPYVSTYNNIINR